VSAGAAERYDGDYLQRMLPDDRKFQVSNVTTSRGCFVVAGPKARDVMAKLTDARSTTRASLAHRSGDRDRSCDRRLRARVNFIGELGWELHFPIEYANGLFERCSPRVANTGVGMVGMRAMESLRIEKSYRMWGSDLTPDYTPFDAGLDRFVRLEKGDFIGKAALARQREAGVPNRFRHTRSARRHRRRPLGNEPLFVEGRSSAAPRRGAMGTSSAKSLALAYVQPAHAAVGASMEIEILGERKRATVVGESPVGSGEPAASKLSRTARMIVFALAGWSGFFVMAVEL
jgi:dimethylglycine dehydrogenase